MINREIMSKAQDLASEWEETDEPNVLVLAEAILELVMPIVRELAESDPTQDDAGLTYCVHCDAQEDVGTPLTHADTCLWLRARKMAGLETK